MKKSFYRMLAVAMAVTLSSGMMPGAVFAAEPKQFQNYTDGGFIGRVKWNIGKLIGCIEDVSVPVDTGYGVGMMHIYSLAVIRSDEKTIPIGSVEKIYNMKPYTTDSGWVNGYVWDSSAKAFRFTEYGASYAASAAENKLNLYPGNAKLIDISNGMMKQMEDINGSSGGTMILQFALLLSEADEAYFLEHGTIPGLEGLQIPQLKEMLLAPSAIQENAVRQELKIGVDGKEPVAIDAFYNIQHNAPYMYPKKALTDEDFKKGIIAKETQYFIKLRDLAQLLNGTAYQFSIGWNKDTKCIEIKKGEPYQSVGTELQPGTGNRWAAWVDVKAAIDGKPVRLITDKYKQTPYIRYDGKDGRLIENFLLIDGNYYTTIETIGGYLGIPIWNSESGTHKIIQTQKFDKNHPRKEELMAEGYEFPSFENLPRMKPLDFWKFLS